VFPFAEFDPILRRDLSAVLDAVRREIEADVRGSGSPAHSAAVKSQIVGLLKEAARKGERCPLKLYDRVIRTMRLAEMA